MMGVKVLETQLKLDWMHSEMVSCRIINIMESETNNAPLLLVTKYTIIYDTSKNTFTSALECLYTFSVFEYFISS